MTARTYTLSDYLVHSVGGIVIGSLSVFMLYKAGVPLWVICVVMPIAYLYLSAKYDW